MEDKGTKRRVAVAYIVFAICIIAYFLLSYFVNNKNAAKEPDMDVPSETDGLITDGNEDNVDNDNDTDGNTDDINDDADDKTADQLDIDSCVYNGHIYKVLTDTESLAAWGLPDSVRDTDRGEKFKTLDDKLILYAYPNYACRAVLICNRDDAYSFCVFDGYTEENENISGNDLLLTYGVYNASYIINIEFTNYIGIKSNMLETASIERFYDLFSQLEGERISSSKRKTDNDLKDKYAVSVVLQSGLKLNLEYYEVDSLLVSSGISYKVPEEMKDIFSSILY